jgi:hypothetical protein
MSATEATSNAANRAEFANLKRAAEAEARGAVEAVKRHAPWKYFPSRMSQSSLDYLTRKFNDTYGTAIEKRFAQLDRLNRKLARSDPDWTLRSEAELRALPPTYRGGPPL